MQPQAVLISHTPQSVKPRPHAVGPDRAEQKREKIGGQAAIADRLSLVVAQKGDGLDFFRSRSSQSHSPSSSPFFFLPSLHLFTLLHSPSNMSADMGYKGEEYAGNDLEKKPTKHGEDITETTVADGDTSDAQ